MGLKRWFMNTTAVGAVTTAAALVSVFTTSAWQAKQQLGPVSYAVEHSGQVSDTISAAELDANAPIRVRLVSEDLDELAGLELHWSLLRNGKAIRYGTSTDGLTFSFAAQELVAPSQAIQGEVPAPGLGERYTVSFWAKKEIRRHLSMRSVRVASAFKPITVSASPALLASLHTAATPTFSADGTAPLALEPASDTDSSGPVGSESTPQIPSTSDAPTPGLLGSLPRTQ